MENDDDKAYADTDTTSILPFKYEPSKLVYASLAAIVGCFLLVVLLNHFQHIKGKAPPDAAPTEAVAGT